MQFVLCHPRLDEFRECSLEFLQRHHIDMKRVHVLVPGHMVDIFKQTGVNVHSISDSPVESGPFQDGVHMGKVRTQASQMFEVGEEIVELIDNITDITFQKRPVQDFMALMQECFKLLKGKIQMFGLNPGHLMGRSYAGRPDVSGLHQIYNGCVGFRNMRLTLTLPMREDLDRVMVIFSQGGSVLRRRGHQLIVKDMSCWHSHLGYSQGSIHTLGKCIEDEVLSLHSGVYLRYQGGWGSFGMRLSSKPKRKGGSVKRVKSGSQPKRSHHKQKTGAELAL